MRSIYDERRREKRREGKDMARMAISWHTRNMTAIRKIQERFGMQKKISINYRTPIDIEPRGDEWILLKQLEKDGWLKVENVEMKDLM